MVGVSKICQYKIMHVFSTLSISISLMPTVCPVITVAFRIAGRNTTQHRKCIVVIKTVFFFYKAYNKQPVTMNMYLRVFSKFLKFEVLKSSSGLCCVGFYIECVPTYKVMVRNPLDNLRHLLIFVILNIPVENI